MKTPSRTDWWLCAVLTALLLAGIIFGREAYRFRKYTGEDGQFTRTYRSSISALRSATTCVNVRFLQNGGPLTETKAYAKPVPPDTVRSIPIILQGISWKQDIPVAMINSKVYRTGDHLGGFTLEKIERNSIQLRDTAGRMVEIKLMEDISP